MQELVLDVIFLLFAITIIINSGLDTALTRKKRRKEKLKRQRAEILGQKMGRMEIYIAGEERLVNATNTNREAYMALLVSSVIGGFLLGKLIFSDSIISLALAIICVVLPHALLIIKRNNDRRELAENLESAMRIITHEYMSTLDIERAVENSVDAIVLDKPFREFLVDMKMISGNVERNLRRLESKIDNVYFSSWIDQLIMTQTDRTQISNLSPILDDMNDAKTSQRHNDTMIAGAWRDYFTMLFIILLSPLLIRFVQREWYNYLIHTAIGKGLCIALLASLVWATGRALKINEPITG